MQQQISTRSDGGVDGDIATADQHQSAGAGQPALAQHRAHADRIRLTQIQPARTGMGAERGHGDLDMVGAAADGPGHRQLQRRGADVGVGVAVGILVDQVAAHRQCHHAGTDDVALRRVGDAGAGHGAVRLDPVDADGGNLADDQVVCFAQEQPAGAHLGAQRGDRGVDGGVLAAERAGLYAQPAGADVDAAAGSGDGAADQADVAGGGERAELQIATRGVADVAAAGRGAGAVGHDDARGLYVDGAGAGRGDVAVGRLDQRAADQHADMPTLGADTGGQGQVAGDADQDVAATRGMHGLIEHGVAAGDQHQRGAEGDLEAVERQRIGVRAGAAIGSDEVDGDRRDRADRQAVLFFHPGAAVGHADGDGIGRGLQLCGGRADAAHRLHAQRVGDDVDHRRRQGVVVLSVEDPVPRPDADVTGTGVDHAEMDAAVVAVQPDVAVPGEQTRFRLEHDVGIGHQRDGPALGQGLHHTGIRRLVVEHDGVPGQHGDVAVAGADIGTDVDVRRRGFRALAGGQQQVAGGAGGADAVDHDDAAIQRDDTDVAFAAADLDGIGAGHRFQPQRGPFA